MEKIIINYRTCWDCEGYVIHQTIKLPKSYIKQINEALEKRRKEARDPYSCYLKELSKEQIKGECCLYLRQLSVVGQLLQWPKRMKFTNTRLIFTD